MKKEIFAIAMILAMMAGAYAASGILTDAAETMTTEERLIPIYSVDTDEKKIALTFDAAWGNEDVDRLIEVMNKYKVQATFFVTGEWADRFPDDVKKLSEAGHEIGSHSDKHPHIDNLSSEELKADIDSANTKIRKASGTDPVLYRGPYGEYNNTLINLLHEKNMYYIQWDADSLDWKNPGSDEICANVMKKIRNGSIVLLHCGAKDTASALPSLLESLKAEGYSMVRVSELIYRTNYKTDNSGRQIRVT